MQIFSNIYLVGGLDYHLTYTDWNSADCNVYVVDTRDGLVLIDCGCGETLQEIFNNMENDCLDPADVTYLFLTHAHFNHAGAVHALKRMKATVVSHKEAADAIEAGDDRTRAYAFHKKFIKCEIDQKLENDQTLEVGVCEFKAVHVPGHTNGCMAYALNLGTTELAFTGDLIFADGKTTTKRLPDFNREAYIESLQKLRSMKLDVILPGHGLLCMSRAHIWIENALAAAVHDS